MAAKDKTASRPTDASAEQILPSPRRDDAALIANHIPSASGVPLPVEPDGPFKHILARTRLSRARQTRSWAGPRQGGAHRRKTLKTSGPRVSRNRCNEASRGPASSIARRSAPVVYGCRLNAVE